MSKDFYVIIEKGEDGLYFGEVSGLKGCYSQGKSVEELMINIREAIELHIEDEPLAHGEFIGVQKISIEHDPANAQG